jgi:hypothetical protein
MDRPELTLTPQLLSSYAATTRRRGELDMNTFTGLMLWCILFLICWPLAILALILFPIVWLLLLPLRLMGVAVDGIFAFIRALLLLPARLLGERRAFV